MTQRSTELINQRRPI